MESSEKIVKFLAENQTLQRLGNKFEKEAGTDENTNTFILTLGVANKSASGINLFFLTKLYASSDFSKEDIKNTFAAYKKTVNREISEYPIETVSQSIASQSLNYYEEQLRASITKEIKDKIKHEEHLREKASSKREEIRRQLEKTNIDAKEREGALSKKITHLEEQLNEKTKEAEHFKELYGKTKAVKPYT